MGLTQGPGIKLLKTRFGRNMNFVFFNGGFLFTNKFALESMWLSKKI